MRIFFSMQHLGSFLVYEPVIRELAARGHRLHLAVSRTESLGWEHALEQVLAENSQITWGWLSPSPSTSAFWFELAKTTRLWADYLRYFEPHYASAPKLRARAEERVPPRLVRISQRPLFQTPTNRQRLLSALRTLERALPPVREIQQQLKEYRPDVVVVTPLVYLGSWQFEVLRAALAEGLRTAFAVGSWDHLSSKALIRDLPQRIFVWNETQKEEAVRFHRVPADRIVVTGAQCYDQWFGRVPRRTREEFCRHVGLPDDRPFILYVCSALFWGSPVEAEFVRRWVQSLRASAAPELSGAGILVRPHPARTTEWPGIDLSSYGGVALHGANPKDADSKEDYFESLFYSHAVVGLNTSAFLEAAVVGRPLHTILVPEFSENQEGTLHFHYLLNVGGGVLQTSRSFEQHHEQLVVSLRDPACRAAANQQFVREFIRPHGLDVPATPAFCDALDDLLQAAVPRPERTSARLVLLRWLAYPMFLVLRRVYGTELFRDDWKRHDPEHQRQLESRERERQTRRQAAQDVKRLREHRRAEKEAVREAAVRATRAERAAGKVAKARRLQAKARETSARGVVGRLVARLTGAWQLERLAAIEEKVGKFGRAQREALAEQRRQLQVLNAALPTLARAGAVHEVERRLARMEQQLDQRDRALSEAFERARVLDEQGVNDRRFARRMEELLRDGRPVIVGPWTGEVGFELIYWIPFVRWVVGTYGLSPDRLLVVSRGGTAAWYGGIAARYADAFDFFSPEEFRAATEAGRKQRRVGAFDAELAKRVVSAHRLGRADLLHPGLMYRLFMPFWKETASITRVDKYASYARLGPADDPVLSGLPAEYVAARFYFSECFPDTSANREFVASALESISQQTPVVLLNTPFGVDDHHDFESRDGRVLTVGDHMTPSRNLAVQTAVIARARAFVGTYGGYSYLAPFCGVSSLAFYAAPSFKAQHLEVARRIFTRLGGASVTALDVASAPVARFAMSGGNVHAS